MDYLSKFQSNKLLKELSTFAIGGPARYFYEVSDIPTMCSLMAYCSRENIPCLVIGKGSNCLFDDKGYDGLVLLNKISFCQIAGGRVEVGAGYSFSLLGVQTARKGLSGLEFASGIPASVGGAVYMNAGANRQETKDCLKEVGYVDERGEFFMLKKEDILFSYRFSSFQQKKGAIVSATFELVPKESARKDQLAIIEYRTATQPYGDKSAGCVFRNQASSPAGALIEKSGLKGFSIGGAEVSTLHANFIINKGNAKASDVLELAAYVKSCVKEKTGHELEMEIRWIPYQS